MNCVVCGDVHGPCEFCRSFKSELLENGPVTPGNIAVFDQSHAAAIDALRGAHCYLLVYAHGDGLGAMIAGRERRVGEMDEVVAMAALSVTQYGSDVA